MANFHQHVAVSTALGIGYGAAAYFGFGIDWATCVIAGGFTGLAGMLPDLDSPSGKPVREIFGLGAALVPVLLVEQLSAAVSTLYEAAVGQSVDLTPQALVVVIAACYFAVRFGGAWLLDRLTVHRGMFHSIPAAIIVAVAAFLLVDAPNQVLRLFLAGGPLLGFLSHLVMDEIWSVKLSVGDVGLKKSAGTAFKLFSVSLPATITCYIILLGLSYLVLHDRSLGEELKKAHERSWMPKVASDLIENVWR